MLFHIFSFERFCLTLRRKIPLLGGEDFGCGLQDYGILYSDKWLSVFQRTLLPPI